MLQKYIKKLDSDIPLHKTFSLGKLSIPTFDDFGGIACSLLIKIGGWFTTFLYLCSRKNKKQ